MSTRTSKTANGGSFRRAKPAAKKELGSGVKFVPLKDDWEAFKRLSDKEAVARARSDPDAQPLPRAFWKDAKVIWPEPKQLTSLRIDPDVIAWFKAQGKGYQTRMNAVLKAYMKAQSR